MQPCRSLKKHIHSFEILCENVTVANVMHLSTEGLLEKHSHLLFNQIMSIRN